MDRHHRHAHQALTTTGSDNQGDLTTNHSSIDLDDLRAFSLDTQTIVSDLSGSEPALSDDEQAEQHLTSTTTHPITSSQAKKPPWLPYTLRWFSLGAILLFSSLLELAVLVVHVVSVKNSGLVEDNGSKAIVVGSKFVPTLLAVALGLLATILLDDVKRTEPFAKMASASGASAKESVTWTGGSWWTIPKPLGKGRLPLFCATLVFILASLAVSPLSSTLLVTRSVVFDTETQFHQLNLNPLAPIQPAPLATTYFRTISNILKNVSTTAWISNDYVVVPFWPDGPSRIPLSPILSDHAQIWSSNTTIFSVDLDCTPMNTRWNSPALSSPTDSTHISITLISDSGCTVDLELGEDSEFFYGGGWIWSSVSNVSGWFHNWLKYDTSHSVTVHGCSENEMFVSWTRVDSVLGGPDRSNFFMTGQACQNTYYAGHATTSMTMGQGQSTFTVNETEYQLNKVPIAASLVNTAAIDNIFFDLNWTIHLNAADFINGGRDIASAGPANLIAAQYQFSEQLIIADVSVIWKLRRIRRQFFAELLHSTFELQAVTNAINTTGSVITSSRRVVVVPGVAIALEVVLFIQIILIATIWYTTRPSRRPLGLTEDPSSIISVAKLISGSPSTVKTFAECSDGTVNNLDQSLARVHFISAEDQIDTFKTSTFEGPSNEYKAREKSTLFPRWLLALLLLLLFLTLAAIATLYRISQLRGLYDTFLVYNIGISISGHDLGAINLASLFTTLIAVVIGLWWGFYDTTLRKIQPYIALSKSPVSGYKGVAISYKSSYLLWAAYRAAKRSHWVLLLSSTGAFLAQILTIAMSSLWTREPGHLTTLIPVPKVLELRTVPELGVNMLPKLYHFATDSRGVFVQSLFADLSTSWIYGATTQLTLDGPDPPWSIDGWSFVPSTLNMTSLEDVYVQNTGNATELSASFVNITMETPAIRARIECSPYTFLDDETRWLTKWDLTDNTHWNTSANPKDLKVGYELGVVGESWDPSTLFHVGDDPNDDQWTTFFVNFRRLECCENTTDGSVGLASIGYWSANVAEEFQGDYPFISDIWPANFTVKWIHGRATESIRKVVNWPDNNDDNENSLIWLEPPRMTALNCQPIIETANSRVTVYSHNERVTSYEILETPRSYEEAWDSPWLEYTNSDIVEEGFHAVNITVSHGVLFVTGLLGAADTADFGAGPVGFTVQGPAYSMEHTQEQTFNIRQPGLNVDYMTYAMLSMVEFDHEQLLNATILEQAAQRTFSTMYQHFVNSNLSLTTGGYAYQPLGEKLPDDIGQLVSTKRRKRQTSPAKNDTNSNDVILEVSRPVELLNISTPAVWISLVILAYLIIACGTLAIVSRQYNQMLSGPTATIADTAALVAGSAKLLELAQSQSTSDIKKDRSLCARLAWFDDDEGRKRWGVELCDEHGTGDGISK
ncbi:hypothetical protein F4803DRAFT_509535 [Xylaria telfairii]|nr:hypothetical protein F4803DRAFT_509535 [Xylaria telfairii]